MKKINYIPLSIMLCCQTTFCQTFTDSIFHCKIIDNDPTSVSISLNDTLNRNQKKNLKTLTIPSVVHNNDKEYKVNILSEYGFSGNCDIQEIIIEEGIKTIRKGCFCDNKSLHKIFIPSSITEIEEGILSNCNQLESIFVDEKNPYYDSRDSCNAIIKTIPNTLISGCNKTIIPSTVKSIGKKAFQSCYNIESIIFPEGLQIIEFKSFCDCISLAKIQFPNSCLSISGESFDGCQSLEEVNIPSSVYDIDYNPFTNCPKLQTIKIDSKNKYFNSKENCNAIIRNDLNKLISGCYTTNIPQEVREIGLFAFKGATRITEINLGKNIVQIDDGAFAGIPYIKKITVSSENANYDSRENSNCIIETKSNRLVCGSVDCNIPNSITSIGNYAFYGAFLPRIFKIPNHIIEIGRFAFAYCKNMNVLVIPSSIREINTHAFKSCHDLQRIEIDSNNIKIGTACFAECTNLSNVYISEGIKMLPELLFNGCSSLKEFYFPASITYIMQNTFEGCPFNN